MENINVQEYLMQANALMGQENYEGALQFLEKAEKEDKFNLDIYVTKGVAYANIENYVNAKKEFEKALKVNKKEGVVYFHLGNIELLSGNKAEGIGYYNNAIAYGYDEAQLYFSLGLMYEEDGNDDLAIRNYSKATLRDPIRADIRIRKIRLYIKNKHMQEALQALDELMLANPDVFEGYHLKFLVLVDMGKLAEAEKVLTGAMNLFPKDVGFALDKASLLITQKEYQAALSYLEEIERTMETEPDDRRSIAMERARIYALLEDMKKTIESLETARTISLLKEPPFLDLEALYLLMNCYLNEEDNHKVIECARELKKAEGEEYYSIAAYYYEPLALKNIGKSEEAKKLFKEAVSYYRNISLQHPGNMDSYAFRIMSLREISEYDKALELAEYLVMMKGDLAESHTLKATVLEDLGRTDEAKIERNIAVSCGGILAELPANNQ